MLIEKKFSFPSQRKFRKERKSFLRVLWEKLMFYNVKQEKKIIILFVGLPKSCKYTLETTVIKSYKASGHSFYHSNLPKYNDYRLWIKYKNQLSEGTGE